MIQEGTILNVCDKTGVMLVKCIKVLGPYKKRIAFIGDLILVSVQRINPRKLVRIKLFRRKRYFVGTMHRALVVRGKCNYWRMNTVYIKFNENSVVLVNKKVVPVSKRVYGPILKELCMRWPTLGCVSRLMI